MTERINYSEDPAWVDITPLPQDDGPSTHALATIAYTEEYKEAMSYLRAVMALNELSPRVLDLTAHIISLNPAHYTVWLYRAKVLEATDADLQQEIKYLNEIALKHIKNYQIWHHRQLILERLGDPTGEQDFLAKMFELDAKNYHVWSYRQWLVKKFGLWAQGELEEVERLLRLDVRNNSAWNFRWFLVFGREGEIDAEGKPFVVSEDVWEREVEFAKDAVSVAPQNESPWNYLRGLYADKQSARPLNELEGFAVQFATINDNGEEVRSSHALDLLADIYAKEERRKEEAVKALKLLEDKYDPIRANYWRYKRATLNQEGKESRIM